MARMSRKGSGSFGKQTVSDASRSWLACMQAAGLKQSALEQYRRIIERHLLPGLGRVRLINLTSEALQDFRENLNKEATPNTQWRALRLVDAILRDAEMRGDGVTRFSRQLSHVKRPAPKRRHVPDLSDVHEMIAASERMASTQPGYEFRWALKVLLETAMLPLEACSLTRRCIDLERGEICICTPQRFTQSHRRVPITRTLSRELAHLELSAPDDLVFPSFDPDRRLNKRLGRALHQLQLVVGLTAGAAEDSDGSRRRTKYTLYDLRLIAVTWWCHAGLSLEHVCYLTGRRVPCDRWSHIILPAHQPVKPEITAALERELYGDRVIQ